MSAFMVSDQTINKAVTFISHRYLKDSSYLKDKFLELGLDTESPDFCGKLGQAMFDLNIRGVNTRYGEGEAQDFRPLDYKYTPEYNVPAIWAWKALVCWNYQCSEGDVIKDPFYKLMNQLEGEIAGYILRRSPEYDAAPWD